MESVYHYDLPGNVVDGSTLQHAKAAELFEVLSTSLIPFVTLVECRRDGVAELVVLDIAPEVPQYPANDIRKTERIAAVFRTPDSQHPEALALRVDFPAVPHLNLRSPGVPKSLCLTEVVYEEDRLRWTAPRFLRRLHLWLSRTSRGDLHAPDQELEPLFFGPLNRVILPASMFEPESHDVPERLAFLNGGRTANRSTYIAVRPEDLPADSPGSRARIVGLVYEARPRTHGLIQLQPRNLKQLHEFLSQADEDLLDALRDRIMRLHDAKTVKLKDHLMILLRIPKRRMENATPEAVDVSAFATVSTILEVGEDIGLWVAHEGVPGGLKPIDDTRQGENVELELLDPISALTPAGAADINDVKVMTSRLAVIGVGALGSQVANNLLRVGVTDVTLVDGDVLLPHNVARHLLPGVFIGQAKAEATATYLNMVYQDEVVHSINSYVPSDQVRELLDSLTGSDVVLDMSASVAVARHLSIDMDTQARRISMFMNPDGTDLVFLAEPPDRAVRLDHLEMEYYRAVTAIDGLAGHLTRHGTAIRYSHACREASARLSNHQVVLHGALGTRAVLGALSSTDARIAIWQSADSMEVRLVEIDPGEYREIQCGEWTVSVSHSVLSKIHTQRTERLPCETGGVLIGSFDASRSRVYIVEHIGSPPDSEEWPTAYVRGVDGLADAVEEFTVRSAGQLEYVGEWHSHPDGAGISPSADDCVLFEWLVKHRQLDGLPPVMAIAGDSARTRLFVGTTSDESDIKLNA